MAYHPFRHLGLKFLSIALAVAKLRDAFERREEGVLGHIVGLGGRLERGSGSEVGARRR